MEQDSSLFRTEATMLGVPVDADYGNVMAINCYENGTVTCSKVD